MIFIQSILIASVGREVSESNHTLFPYAAQSSIPNASIPDLFRSGISAFIGAASGSLLFVLFLGTLVVDDLHMGSIHQLHIVVLCPVHTALQHQGQEYPGNIQHHFQSIIGEFHLVISPVSSIADRFQGLLADGQQL